MTVQETHLQIHADLLRRDRPLDIEEPRTHAESMWQVLKSFWSLAIWPGYKNDGSIGTRNLGVFDNFSGDDERILRYRKRNISFARNAQFVTETLGALGHRSVNEYDLEVWIQHFDTNRNIVCLTFEDRGGNRFDTKVVLPQHGKSALVCLDAPTSLLEESVKSPNSSLGSIVESNYKLLERFTGFVDDVDRDNNVAYVTMKDLRGQLSSAEISVAELTAAGIQEHGAFECRVVSTGPGRVITTLTPLASTEHSEEDYRKLNESLAQSFPKERLTQIKEK